jgi:adenine-specific DNA-methyltransferase
LATEDRRPNLHYDLIDPKTGINYGRPRLGWRYDQKTMAKLIADERILWPASPDGRPRKKSFLNELKGRFTGFSSIIGTNVYTKHGTEDITTLFGGRAMDFPKPVSLVKELLMQGSDDDCIVLDFFAGSGSLGQAIYQLNRETHGHRRFILVQLPEPTQANSEARSLGYASIADVAKERLRRTVKRLKAGKTEELCLDSEAPLDEGFRVFKLAPSNFRIWHAEDAPPEEDELAKQLELYAENVLPGHSRQEILYELVLKAGFPLHVAIEERRVGKAPVFWIDGGALAICLEDRVTKELLRGLMELKPGRVLCLDHAFGENDQLKTNAVLEMKALGVVFQTV